MNTKHTTLAEFYSAKDTMLSFLKSSKERIASLAESGKISQAAYDAQNATFNHIEALLFRTEEAISYLTGIIEQERVQLDSILLSSPVSTSDFDSHILVYRMLRAYDMRKWGELLSKKQKELNRLLGYEIDESTEIGARTAKKIKKLTEEVNLIAQSLENIQLSETQHDRLHRVILAHYEAIRLENEDLRKQNETLRNALKLEIAAQSEIMSAVIEAMQKVEEKNSSTLKAVAA